MILFALLGGLAAATAVNAPGLFIGYGLTYSVMLLGAWMFRPSRAAALVLIAMLIALPFYLIPKSIFTPIAILSVVLRPSLAYVASRVHAAKGKLASAFALTAMETGMALTIGILYYGVDAVQTGFAIYGGIFAFFCYPTYLYFTKAGALKAVGVVSSFLAMVAYFLAFFAALAPWMALMAVASLALLILATRRELEQKRLVHGAFVVVLLGFALGGQALLSNFSTSMYPFNPSSWTGSKWAQDNPSCPVSSNLFASVHDPARLRVVNTCVTATGQVELTIEHETDGDFAFQLKVTSSDAPVISLSSYLLWGGYVHVEIVPADQQRLLSPIGGGVCPGDTVKVSGALVIDTDHGMYTELHPVYFIQAINSVGNWPACMIESATP